MFLLDTNICIYLMKNTYPKLTERLFSHDTSDMAISAITVYELEYGAAKSKWGDKTRQNMQLFLAPFTIVPFDATDAMIAGQIREYLEQEGNPIGPYDLQIASQAIARKMTVVTHNVDEFRRVPGIVLEDWVV